jgi:hypothetical protein
MDRPTIFLSSTVHDFADLRSALKDYLELRGCRVLASEFTDFTRPLDAHSYEACLQTIEQADLFVLFIGRRVGGWFDEPAKISITRAEYRHAYKLAQDSRIRLLCFVRSEVFDHRQSVRDLTRALKADASLNEDQRQRLANHPSLAMENSEAIIAFIDEVTRNGETMAASKGLATAPVANWISPFTTFTQVRQALDPLIAHGLSVSQAAGRKALEVQLVELLQQVVPVIGGRAMNPVNTVLNVRNALNIQANQLTQKIKVPEKIWTRLLSVLTFSAHGEADPAPLLGALGSDLLLQYNPATGTYQQTGEYDLLVRVVDQARLLKRSGQPDLSTMVEHGRAADSSGARHVPAAVLMAWLHRLLRWVDLISSARALAAALGGQPFVPPPQVPRSPLMDQEGQLASETATVEQIQNFIAGLDPAQNGADST